MKGCYIALFKEMTRKKTDMVSMVTIIFTSVVHSYGAWALSLQDSALVHMTSALHCR